MTVPDLPPPPSPLDLVAEALGDPTRRAIFLYLCDSPAAQTATEVGRRFGIHRTVARAHLERLVEHGWLAAHFRRAPGEGGRPPKVYSRSERRLQLQVPMRQYELLASLLLGTLEQFGPAADLLVGQMGFAYGQSLAVSGHGHSPQDRLEPLVRAGARCTAFVDEEALHVELRDCVFREVTPQRPNLVCTLDRAIVAGLLSTPDEAYTLRDAQRRCPEDDRCRLTFVTAGSGADPSPGRRDAGAPPSTADLGHCGGGEERA